MNAAVLITNETQVSNDEQGAGLSEGRGKGRKLTESILNTLNLKHKTS